MGAEPTVYVLPYDFGQEDNGDQKWGYVTDDEEDSGNVTCCHATIVVMLLAEEVFWSEPTDVEARQYRHRRKHIVGRHRIEEVKQI